MPFDGNGNYTLPPGTEATPGTLIDATPYNAFLADIVSALSSLLRRAGDSAMTGNLPMGSNRITGLADGASDSDAVNKGQLDSAVEAMEASFDALELTVKKVPFQTSGLATGECFSTSANQTIPPDLPVNNVYEIFNNSTSVSITLSPGSGVTLGMFGSTITGGFTLGPRGLCTIKVIGTNSYMLTGPGLSV